MQHNTLYSMTGFARAQDEGEWGQAVCELRSTNHRYLEMSIHIPESLREIESTVRDQIRHHIKRGKVECYIRFHPSPSAQGAELNVNVSLAKQLCQINNQISQLIDHSATVNVMDVLKWPGVLQISELDLETIEDALVHLLEKSLIDLVNVRAREGQVLQALFFKRLEAMRLEIEKAKTRMPEVLKHLKEKLMARFADAKIEFDPARFEQEIVLLAQRIDVTEELDRLGAHIQETHRILQQGGTAGRRLDFLMQELHREANTLGAKSVDVELTRVSVELKVLIEQMREQVQNVE